MITTCRKSCCQSAYTPGKCLKNRLCACHPKKSADPKGSFLLPNGEPMSTTSTLSGTVSATYPRAHAKLMRFLSIYHDKLIDSALLDDLDVFVTRVVSPAFGATVDPDLFDYALIAYGNAEAAKDGSHEDLRRNGSGTVDNSLDLIDSLEETRDAEMRNVLNSIGIS